MMGTSLTISEGIDILRVFTLDKKPDRHQALLIGAASHWNDVLISLIRGETISLKSIARAISEGGLDPVQGIIEFGQMSIGLCGTVMCEGMEAVSTVVDISALRKTYGSAKSQKIGKATLEKFLALARVSRMGKESTLETLRRLRKEWSGTNFIPQSRALLQEEGKNGLSMREFGTLCIALRKGLPLDDPDPAADDGTVKPPTRKEVVRFMELAFGGGWEREQWQEFLYKALENSANSRFSFAGELNEAALLADLPKLTDTEIDRAMQLAKTFEEAPA